MYILLLNKNPLLALSLTFLAKKKALLSSIFVFVFSQSYALETKIRAAEENANEHIAPQIALDKNNAANNISGKSMTYKNAEYFVVDADLSMLTLRLYWKNSAQKSFNTIDNLKKELAGRGENLIFATNAGIYAKDFTPLGLHIEKNMVFSKLNQANPHNPLGNFSLKPNGVFFIHNNVPKILETSEFASTFNMQAKLETITVATQSGPLLLQNGRIHPHFLPNSDSFKIRNAVCTKPIKTENVHHLNTNSQTVSFIVSQTEINFYDFTAFLKNELNCLDALYLDGSLSQIFYRNAYYGAPFWHQKSYVGILGISD